MEVSVFKGIWKTRKQEHDTYGVTYFADVSSPSGGVPIKLQSKDVDLTKFQSPDATRLIGFEVKAEVETFNAKEGGGQNRRIVRLLEVKGVEWVEKPYSPNGAAKPDAAAG